MKASVIAALCSAQVFCVACSTASPLKTQPLAPGTTISGTPYYLPRSLLRLEINRKASPPTATLTVENRPDHKRKYQAVAEYSAGANDKFTITRNEHGLLSTVTIDTEDQADAITEALTTQVSDILSRSAERRALAESAPEFLSVLIDPFDPKVMGNGDEISGVIVKSSFADPTVKAAAKAAASGSQGIPCPTDAAICVPTLTPVTLEVDAGTAKFDFAVSVAHPSHVMGLRVDRRPCVQTKTTLTLKQGMIETYDVDKPSELAGCLSIPLDVVAAIVAAPVDALTGRKARLDAEKEVVNAQKELLTKEQELLSAQIEAAKAVTTGNDGQ